MTSFLRLFVGIDVGDAWTARLSGTADRLRRSLGNGVRWVRPELFHVTVVFLGDQAPEQVPSLDEALQATAESAAPFRLQLLDLRRIGGHERGALVAGVHDPDGALQALRASLDVELHQRGIRFDSKPLRPHVTLGRPRNGARPFEVPRINLGDAPPLQVHELRLMQSDLLPSGPRYTTVSGFTFQVAGSREYDSKPEI